MPPSPDPVAEPVIEVIDGLVSAELQAAAWKSCAAKRWYFGHGSHPGDWTRYWKLDLDDDPAVAALWEAVRARCEALAGSPLRLLRVYANGHTYGLGGRAHADDERPGTFTLLYYPMPEWKDGWDGETIYFDSAGEIALAVRPRPNRAVFFDSRILHEGRSPSRVCPALRVTIAFKLEIAPPAASDAPETVELSREGARRVYSIRIPAAAIDGAASGRLRQIGRRVRLPGYRAGEVPESVLAQRYGEKARREAIEALVAATLGSALPQGSVPEFVELRLGANAGDAEARVAVTVLSDLPDLDVSSMKIVRRTAPPEEADRAAEALRQDLKRQALDFLDATYRFPLRPLLVDRELSAILATVEADAGQRAELEKELRPAAERRVRLGFVVAELGRRLGVRAASGPDLEEKVIDTLLERAPTEERAATKEELRELLGD